MLAARGYPTKKSLREAKGSQFRFTETSLFGPEMPSNGTGTVTVVGPSPYERKWFATVKLDNFIITEVK